MDNLQERLRARRKELKLTQAQLAKRAGVSQTTIADIERGRNKGSAELATIAHALQTDAYWLTTGKENPHAAQRLSDYNVEPAVEQKLRVPLISWVSAGSFVEAIDNHQPGQADEWIDVSIKPKRNSFALRVVGDSMTSAEGISFPEGMIIIVEPEMAAESNDFVIAKRDDGEVTFKQLVKDSGEWFLKPLNSRYPMRSADGMEIVGVVREAVIKFR
jgi:SOS-response transcriptional repressor LexA